MSLDCRNQFLTDVKLAILESQDPDVIVSKITVLLEKYELTERTTDLIPRDSWNVDLIKTYTSALIVDGKSQNTIRQYLLELKQVGSYFGSKKLTEIGAYDIRSYLAKRKLDGLSSRTLENVRAILHAFFGWLAAEEYIPKNPCASIKPIKYADEIRLPFSNVEIDKLRSACKNHKERAMIEFLLATGVRVAEFCDLDVEDINFAEGKVRIRHGKGNKERYTYMNELAKEHLLKYLDGRTSGPLFISQQKNRYKKCSVRFVLHSIGDRAGVDDVHPHRFRRTFATALASRGMNIQEIQKLMGHANINTTMLYVTLSDAATKYSYMKYYA